MALVMKMELLTNLVPVDQIVTVLPVNHFVLFGDGARDPLDMEDNQNLNQNVMK